MAIVMIYRTTIAAEDVPAVNYGINQPWNEKPSGSLTAKVVFKEAGNVIDWALENNLKIEVEYQYSHVHHVYEVAVYARVHDEYQRMVLELSKPDPIRQNV